MNKLISIFTLLLSLNNLASDIPNEDTRALSPSAFALQKNLNKKNNTPKSLRKKALKNALDKLKDQSAEEALKNITG